MVGDDIITDTEVYCDGCGQTVSIDRDQNDTARAACSCTEVTLTPSVWNYKS